MLAKFECHSSIDHILTAPKAAANTQHSIFGRTVECPNGNGMSTLIITIASSKVPFVIWVKILRMQSCQSCCTSTYSVNTISQFVNRISHTRNTISICLNLVIQCC